jgi:hypothetical protein
VLNEFSISPGAGYETHAPSSLEASVIHLQGADQSGSAAAYKTPSIAARAPKWWGPHSPDAIPYVLGVDRRQAH